MATEVIIGAICSPTEFDDNLKIDFSSFIRSKGGISYLPWAEIVRTLHKKISGCTYGFKPAADGGMVHYTPDGGAYFRPYLTRCFFTPEGGINRVVETPPGFFPVSAMASRHKALVNPDIRHIDNCLRRCIAKEIGLMTGIGLQLWAAEDPYDLSDEEEDSCTESSKTAKSSTIGSRGTDKSVTRASAPTAAPGRVNSPSGAAPGVSLNSAAEAAGLTEHGKQTIAMAVRAESWDQIPPDKVLRIIPLLASADNVKLFNDGRNSSGKVINPKSKEQETRELVDAFRSVSTAPSEDA